MNIRIALLVIGSLMAGGSSAAWAVAMKPLDPDQAPIAAVDRFSDKAATIYMRNSDDRLPGHIPGPNEPVDFDTGPFITQGHGQAGALLQFRHTKHHSGAALRLVP